jgi:putative zinc finger/helix-turn-helix YgiT family protein
VTETCECLECGKVVEPRIEKRREALPVRGEDTEVVARVGVCPECGADMSIAELDDATLVAAFNMYRQRHGLMTPEEMKRLRESYGLSVRGFSLLLGWGEITAHRYEKGSLQDPAHEAALRLAEDQANLRIYLTANGHKLTARQRAHLETHLQALEAETQVCATVDDERFVVREERDVYGGWTPMQLSKMREMMVFFATLPDMYATKLNKLLFYADFGHFRDFGASISGSPYLAMQFGPVPQHYPWIEEDLLEGGDLLAKEIFFKNGDSHVTMSAAREPDLSVFSGEEIATLRRVERVLGHKTSKRLSELSHEERAWAETPTRSMIPYDLARDLAF